MRCGKKAQYQNAFLYISGLIIFIFLIIGGIYFISKGSSTSKEMNVKLFESKFSDDLDAFKMSSHGTLKSYSYRLANDIDEICFIDLEKAKENIDVFDIIKKTEIKKSIEAESQANVFFFGKNTQKSIEIKNLKLSQAFSCIDDINSKVEFKLKNERGEIVVRTPVNEEYCQSAQTSNICNELDVFFYEGYKEECCNEVNLCCS